MYPFLSDLNYKMSILVKIYLLKELGFNDEFISNKCEMLRF